MKILISTYMFVLLFGLMAFISMEFVVMNRETNLARSFHEICLEKIENSYFDPLVIEECKNSSIKNGYNLYMEDKSEYIGNERVPSYFVKLEYKVNMPILGIEKNAVICGYAV